MKSKEKKRNVGWECPRCGIVNSPDKEVCDCVQTESTEKDTKQLLTE